jgi:glycerophosphoryl diester phosphodiesterase
MSGARPSIIAHRGSSHSAPEHTLQAYRQAIAEGADALECDVRLTRDGHLVCVHDRRIDRTSNGTGTVSEFDLATLGQLDFAAWKNERSLHAGEDQLVGGVEGRAASRQPAPVLTLETLLQEVLAAPRRVRLLIETKHPTRYAGQVEKQLVRLLRRYGLADPRTEQSSVVTVMSFSELALRRVRQLAPRLPTVLLIQRPAPWRASGRLPRGVAIAGPGIRLLRGRPDFVRRVQAHGHPVYAWTVNNQNDLDVALSFGVAGLITDRPADVLEGIGHLG